jgi:hypothetical protein
MGEMRYAYKILIEKSQGKRPKVGGRTILNCILEKLGVKVWALFTY